MRINTTNCLLVNLFISIFLLSCQKEVKNDSPGTGSSTGTVVNPSPVQGTVTGKVVDNNNNAVEGFSHVEIGKMLGINEGTSRSQYARARALLISWIKKNDQVNFKTGIYAGK